MGHVILAAVFVSVLPMILGWKVTAIIFVLGTIASIFSPSKA